MNGFRVVLLDNGVEAVEEGPLLHFFKKLFNLTSFMEKIVVFFQVAFN